MPEFDEKYWIKEVTNAIKYRENSPFYDMWPEYLKLYRNIFPSGSTPYNCVYSIGRTTVVNTYGGTPYINATPRRPEFAPIARIIESAANYLASENETEDNMRTVDADTYLYGVGINETGFMPAPKQGSKDFKRAMMKPKEGQILDIHYDTSRSPGMPWEQRINPPDFLVAYGTRRIYRAAWAATVEIKRTEELKEMDGFKPSLIKGTDSVGSYRHFDTSKDDYQRYEKAEEEFTRYYKIHDARTKMVYYLPYFRPMDTQENSKMEFIRDPEVDMTQVDGLPFAVSQFNDDPYSFWVMPDAALVYPYCKEMTEIRTQAQLHRALALLRVCINQDYFDKDVIRKLKEDPTAVGELIMCTGTDDIRKAIMSFTPHMPLEQLTVWFNQLWRDLLEVLGVNRNTVGEYMTGRRSATESDTVFHQQFLRFEEKRKGIAKCLEMTVRKKLQYALLYWQVEQILPVMGYDGKVNWVRFTPKDIAAEYMLKIDSETLTPVTERMQRQEKMELLGILAKFPNINVTPILAQLMQHSGNWFDVMELLPQAAEQAPISMGQFEGKQKEALNTNSNALQAFAG